MIPAAILVGLAVLAATLWHMRRPRPPRMTASFARFIPELPPASSRRTRFVLTRPQDPAALVLLLVAAALALWALLDGRRAHQAARGEHVGLRIVLDLSHSMSAGGRFEAALARLEEARRRFDALEAGSRCLEILAAAARIAPASSVAESLDGGPLREGADPARLIEAARAPQDGCALTHVLTISDSPPAAPGWAAREGGPLLLWDQVGAPIANAGIRSLALRRSAFGASRPEIVIQGVYSGGAPPRSLRLKGPAGERILEVEASAEAPGVWLASAAYAGPGDYEALLTEGGGYDGDDAARVRLEAPDRAEAEWRIRSLARPAALAEGGAGSLLVAEAADLRPEDLERPLLIVYPAFAARGEPRIGVFTEDPVLSPAVNFDALEVAAPRAFSGPLPEGFLPVLTDAGGGVVIARRREPPGLLLPEPSPRASEPERSLSLTLFFSGLADLAAAPPEEARLTWFDASGEPVAEAWRESATARPLGPPADLGLLAAGTAAEDEPFWPWAALGALGLLLVERLRRLALKRRGA